MILCFTPEKKVYETTGANMETIFYDADGNGFHYGDMMILTPGVYQVRAYAQTSPGQSITLEACAPGSPFLALRTNAVTMRPGQEYLDYEIYVLHTLDSAYFLTEFSNGTVNTALHSLTLYRTNYGELMIFTLLLAIFVGLDLTLHFRQKIILGKVSRADQMAFWILAASVALAYLPYLTDYIFFGTDSAFHMLRIEGLKDALLSGGGFPVRMQHAWLSDHGYPVSFFYGDLFLYFPVLLRLIGFSLMTSYKIFILGILTATAATSFYSFKKCTENTYAALFGSMIYILAPYGIYNIGVKGGGVGELLGMTFLPLVCCGFYRLYATSPDSPDYKRAKYPLIIGISGILNSHFLTTEMVVVFLVVLAVIFAKRTFRRKTIRQLLQAASISLGLNAFFWIPFLVMLSKDRYVLNNLVDESIQNRGIYLAEIFQLFLNMGSGQTGMYHAEPIQLGGALFLLLLGFILYVCFKHRTGYKSNNPYEKPTFILWGITVIIAIMGSKFFSPASAVGALFAAFFVIWLIREDIGSLMTKGVLLFAAIIAVFSAAYHVNGIAYEKEAVRLYSAENLGQIGVGMGEYLPQEINWYDVVDLYTYHRPVAETGLLYTDYNKKATTITMHIQNTQDATKYLEVPLIGYPGYGISSSSDDGFAEDTPYIAAQNGTHEDMRIAIPANWSGTIQIRFEGFLLFRVAELISLLTILLLILTYLYRRKNKFRKLHV
jgi:hypothetical protein